MVVTIHACRYHASVQNKIYKVMAVMQSHQGLLAKKQPKIRMQSLTLHNHSMFSNVLECNPLSNTLLLHAVSQCFQGRPTRLHACCLFSGLQAVL